MPFGFGKLSFKESPVKTFTKAAVDYAMTTFAKLPNKKDAKDAADKVSATSEKWFLSTIPKVDSKKSFKSQKIDPLVYVRKVDEYFGELFGTSYSKAMSNRVHWELTEKKVFLADLTPERLEKEVKDLCTALYNDVKANPAVKKTVDAKIKLAGFQNGALARFERGLDTPVEIFGGAAKGKLDLWLAAVVQTMDPFEKALVPERSFDEKLEAALAAIAKQGGTPNTAKYNDILKEMKKTYPVKSHPVHASGKSAHWNYVKQLVEDVSAKQNAADVVKVLRTFGLDQFWQ